MNSTYFAMYIIKPTLDSDKIKEVITSLNAVFTQYNSELLELKELGIKELQYEIQGFKSGYYVQLKVSTTPEGIKEFNRLIRINENIIRDITVKEEE